MKVFKDYKNLESNCYKAIYNILKKNYTGNEDIFSYLENEIIDYKIGLQVCLGFVIIPVDLVIRITEYRVEDLMHKVNLSYCQTKLLRNTIINDLPMSFVIYLRVLLALYPDNELLKVKELQILIKQLEKL